MQRNWIQTYPAASQAAPQPPSQDNSVNSVSDGNSSPLAYSYHTHEAEPSNELETSSHYDSSSIAENWCQTQMNVIKFNYLWTINNFSYCHEEIGEVLKSSTFGASRPDDKLRWCLRINPKGLDDESKDYLSLYLLLVQSNKPDVRAKFKFSILDADRKESKAMESQRAYRFVQSKDWGFKKFIRRDYLLDENNNLLPDDQLSIYCEVSIVTDAINVTGQSSTHLRVPPPTLSDDLGVMFTEGLFTDCSIRVGTAKIDAHKAILSTRSSVFRAMFSHNGMKESAQNTVTISDLDEETVHGMLHFVYSEHVPDLNRLALKLLKAADKYELKRLKASGRLDEFLTPSVERFQSLCERALCSSLVPQNACEILVHADLHSAEQLKARCISFIICNATEVMNTEGWSLLANDFGPLLAQICSSMAAQHMAIPLSPPRKKRFAANH